MGEPAAGKILAYAFIELYGDVSPRAAGSALLERPGWYRAPGYVKPGHISTAFALCSVEIFEFARRVFTRTDAERYI